MNDTEHTVECPDCKTLIKQPFFRVHEFCDKCQKFFGNGIYYREKPMTQPNNSHYTGGIQPFEYIRANNLDFFEGNVVKYVTRWRKKGGVEDLMKAKVYIEELINQARQL